jgi:hypothetical protein
VVAVLVVVAVGPVSQEVVVVVVAVAFSSLMKARRRLTFLRGLARFSVRPWTLLFNPTWLLSRM